MDAERCELLLRELIAFRQEYDVSPTIRELAERCCMSRQTAFRTVQLLCSKGLIRHTHGRNRTMRPT